MVSRFDRSLGTAKKVPALVASLPLSVFIPLPLLIGARSAYVQYHSAVLVVLEYCRYCCRATKYGRYWFWCNLFFKERIERSDSAIAAIAPVGRSVTCIPPGTSVR